MTGLATVPRSTEFAVRSCVADKYTSSTQRVLPVDAVPVFLTVQVTVTGWLDAKLAGGVTESTTRFGAACPNDVAVDATAVALTDG